VNTREQKETLLASRRIELYYICFFEKLSCTLATIIFTLDRIKEKYDILFYVLCNQLYAFIFIDFLIFSNINPSKKVKIRKFPIIGGALHPPHPPGRASPDLYSQSCVDYV
jgi:hypothetical protein